MKRIYTIIVVCLCALMVCCKKEVLLPNGGIQNISMLDSIRFPDSLLEIDGFTMWNPKHTILYLCDYCPMIDSVQIEFNKHFGHVIPDYIKDIEKDWKRLPEEDKKKWLNFCENIRKETGHYPQEIVYESERNLDTVIHGTNYTFVTDFPLNTVSDGFWRLIDRNDSIKKYGK